MKIKNWCCVVLGGLSFNAFSAVELLDAELLAKKNIDNKYQVYNSEIELKQLYDEADVSHYNIESVSNSLNATLNNFQIIAESVKKTMGENSEINNNSLNRLSESINSYNADLAKLVEERNKYVELQNKIQTTEARKVAEDSAREEELDTLRDSIIARLKKEAIEVKTVNFTGSTKCRSVEAPAACLKRKQDLLVEDHMRTVSNGFRVQDTKVQDASLNLEGILSYNIKVDYVIPFSADHIKEINNQLGIDSINLKLTSNVDASYSINGIKVGSGKELMIKDKFNGKVVIKANYNGYTQSSIEDLSEKSEFYYPFQ
ncbi:hypothetical protein [Vibrio hepatarius]|uniref:hypothetical protein n=1 Tax=Vibrio hepatarius TaxID=171383 RepID=UPI00142D80E2|nr:hypothetical protein [Vibrio hepatarius]NIY85160.1 hypothetical protein [Vibrio hepatarius]NVJ56321.1 hypothetical protein [Vibrionaceae bacterium]